jgi:hypothetical protein
MQQRPLSVAPVTMGKFFTFLPFSDPVGEKLTWL